MSPETKDPALVATSNVALVRLARPFSNSIKPMTAVDSGHTAWILVSMALVHFMLPGLAFFYAGLLHRRSVITMIMQNFASMGVIFVLWFFVVFSLCFGETWHFFGSILTYPCFLNVDGAPLERDNDVVVSDIPGLVFAAYQGMFAVITPALMTGAFAARPS